MSSHRIDGRTLADLGHAAQLKEADWVSVKEAVGLVHAEKTAVRDVNASNFMKDNDGKWWIVDVDRAVIEEDSRKLVDLQQADFSELDSWAKGIVRFDAHCLFP
jgi:hypothetical protein